jgi:hypothetical protein
VRQFVAVLLLLCAAGCHPPSLASSRKITPQQLIDSKVDILGEAALKQPDGPSYEFFRDVLPPLRYCDADYRHYPIVLSAPGAEVKAKLISNGCGINLRARQPNWNNEAGTPVHILVGDRRIPFGSDLSKLDGPHYADGYLPIVRLACEEGGEKYGQEVFAPVDPALAARGAVLVKFDLPAVNAGKVELRFEGGYDIFKIDAEHVVRDSTGVALAQLDGNWEPNVARLAVFTKAEHPKTVYAMIFTADGWAATTRAAGGGMAPELEAIGGGGSGRAAATTQAATLDASFYESQRNLTIHRWNDLLAAGTQLDVPEPIVNNAWKTLLVAQHEMIWHDQLNYSALNQYARQYSNESGDTMRSLLLWGHRDVAARGFKPLFIYRRPGIELHDAAFKLEDLADYYFVTRDADLIRQLRPLWQREIDLILSARQPDGLLPKEAYCSDIRTPVRSVNTNANSWRGLRDMAIVLDDIGEHDQAVKLAAICADYKKIILAALDKAIVRDVDPPFVRIALGGEEPISNPITSTRYGSYWNLVIPCVLWSGLFPVDSEPADAIIHYIQRNGGLCMGLTRVQSVRGAWMNVQNIDDLYVIRYSDALLKRDEPDRALVTFYGKLAHGFTRETFIDGESSGIEPNDAFGRQMGLPPNSTANASFLIQLRNLLVQDWDMDDDGKADTLRLAFATPRQWLADGKKVRIDRAPTAFGEVSFEIRSMLSHGIVEADVDLPPRPAAKTLLRLRLPGRYGTKTIELTGRTGHVHLRENITSP